MSKKSEYVAWGLDDASPLDIDESLRKRKGLWRSLNFKLWLIIILLGANLASSLVTDLLFVVMKFLGLDN